MSGGRMRIVAFNLLSVGIVKSIGYDLLESKRG